MRDHSPDSRGGREFAVIERLVDLELHVGLGI